MNKLDSQTQIWCCYTWLEIKGGKWGLGNVLPKGFQVCKSEKVKLKILP